MGIKSLCSCPNSGVIPGRIPGGVPVQSQQLDFNDLFQLGIFHDLG